MCFGGGKKPHNTATTTTSLNGKLYTCSDSAKEVSAHSTLSMPRSRNAHASSPSTYTGPSNTRTRTSPMQHQPAVPAPPPPLPPPPVKNTTLLYKPSVEVEPTPVDAVEQTAKSQDREDGVAKSCHTWKSNKLTEDDLPTLKIIEDPGPREAANERTNNNTEASCSEWSVSVTKHLKPDEKKGGKAQPRRQLKEILAAAGGPKTIVTRTHTQPTQGDDDRLDRTQKISNTVHHRVISKTKPSIEEEHKHPKAIPDMKTGKTSERKEPRGISVSIRVKEDPTPLPLPDHSTKREINKKSTHIQLRD